MDRLDTPADLLSLHSTAMEATYEYNGNGRAASPSGYPSGGFLVQPGSHIDPAVTSSMSYQHGFPLQSPVGFYSPRSVSNNMPVGPEVVNAANILDHNVGDNGAVDFHASMFQNPSVQQAGPHSNGYHPGIIAPIPTALAAPHHNHSDSGVSLPPYGDNLHLQNRVSPASAWRPNHELAPGPTLVPSTPMPKPEVEIKIEQNTLKSRAEKQVDFTLTFQNLPPHYDKIHFPQRLLSKPKYFAPRSEVDVLRKKGNTLHLTVYCVSCTWVKENGLKLPLARAREAVPNVRRDPTKEIDQLKKDDPTHPRQGAELVICRKCKERERKRLGRVKEGVEEVKDFGEWAKYEDDHFVMFNEQEIKALSKEAGSLLRPGELATRTIKFKLRFACYCRHQEEPPTGGYKCIFTLWDFSTMEVLGQKVTEAFSITDDHKVRETQEDPDTTAQASSSNAGLSQPQTPLGMQFPPPNPNATNFIITLSQGPLAMAQTAGPAPIYSGPSLPHSVIPSEPVTPIRQNSRPQSRGQYTHINGTLNRLSLAAAQMGSRPPSDYTLNSGPPLSHYHQPEQPDLFDPSYATVTTNWQPATGYPPQLNNFTGAVEQPHTTYQAQQVSNFISPVEQSATYTGDFVASSASAQYVKEEPQSPSHPPSSYAQSQQFSPTEQATFFDPRFERFSSQASSQTDAGLPSRAQSMTDFSRYFDVMGREDAYGNYPSAPATAVHTPLFTLSRPPSPSFPQQPHNKRQRHGF